MRWTEQLLLSGTVLAFSTVAAAAAPATVDSDLNLRNGPGTNFAVVDTMPAGARVNAFDCAAGWCRVAFNGIEGYAGQAYLDLRIAAAGPAVESYPTAVAPVEAYPTYGYGYGDRPYVYGYPYGYGGAYGPYDYPADGFGPGVVGGVIGGVGAAVGDIVGGALAPFDSAYWYG